MTTEYLILGVILIIMGTGQIWLRHGPGASDLREERRAEQERRLGGPDGTSREGGGSGARFGTRGGRAWNAWTAALGGIGIAVGIALVVLGVLGR